MRLSQIKERGVDVDDLLGVSAILCNEELHPDSHCLRARPKGPDGWKVWGSLDEPADATRVLIAADAELCESCWSTPYTTARERAKAAAVRQMWQLECSLSEIDEDRWPVVADNFGSILERYRSLQSFPHPETDAWLRSIRELIVRSYTPGNLDEYRNETALAVLERDPLPASNSRSILVVPWQEVDDFFTNLVPVETSLAVAWWSPERFEHGYVLEGPTEIVEYYTNEFPRLDKNSAVIDDVPVAVLDTALHLFNPATEGFDNLQVALAAAHRI